VKGPVSCADPLSPTARAGLSVREIHLNIGDQEMKRNPIS